jgi:hypothetical protein
MENQAQYEEERRQLLMNVKQRSYPAIRVLSHCQLMFRWLTRDCDMLRHLNPSFLIVIYCVRCFKHLRNVTSLIKLHKIKPRVLLLRNADQKYHQTFLNAFYSNYYLYLDYYYRHKLHTQYTQKFAYVLFNFIFLPDV